MDALAFHDALAKIWSAVGSLNQYVNAESPWKWAPQELDRAKALLFDLVSSLRLIAGWITPFMPQTAAKLQSQLGGTRIQKGPALFPRK
jgi:methionyl-tRNA synthetase